MAKIERNISIHISDRGHLNISLNMYHCGNQDVETQNFDQNDYYVFYFIKEGSGFLTQKKATQSVHAGQGFVLFPHTEAVLRAEQNKTMNLTWVAFSGYLVDAYLERASLSAYEPVFDDHADHELERMFDRLLNESMHMPNRYCKLMSILYSIFAYLLDNVRQKVHTASYTQEENLLQALDYIDANYYADISVEDIAASVGVNRKELYAIFKKQTGFSPKDYLIYYRMRKATTLLVDPHMSIEAVARSSGYQDQFHFSKQFKKTVGVPPSEYRRGILSGDLERYRSPIDKLKEKNMLPELS